MRSSLSRYGIGYGQVTSSLLLIFPLFLAYDIALVFSPAHNGVDVISKRIFQVVDGDRNHYLYVHLALGVIYLLVSIVLWRRSRLSLNRILSMLFESSIYALTLGSFIVFIMNGLIGADILAVGFPKLSDWAPEFGNAIAISLGAGVHEELVFRLGIMGGGGLLLHHAGFRPRIAVLLAAIVSSVLFAFAHHLGVSGDDFSLSLVVYRGIAGLAFAVIFYFRSLAHAVYSHFLYDLYVMTIY